MTRRWISRSATWLAIMCTCLQSSASASDLPYRQLEVFVGLSRPSLSVLARSEASALRGQRPLIEARNPFQAEVQVRTTYARPRLLARALSREWYPLGVA